MIVNWKARAKNKAFWITLIPAAILLAQMVLKLFGVEFDTGELQSQLLAIVNAVFAVLVILGVVTDPTTDGMSDSPKAMEYEEPAKNVKEV